MRELQIELVSKVATVLLQTHHHQLISTPSARPLLTTLKEILHERIKVTLLQYNFFVTIKPLFYFFRLSMNFKILLAILMAGLNNVHCGQNDLRDGVEL